MLYFSFKSNLLLLFFTFYRFALKLKKKIENCFVIFNIEQIILKKKTEMSSDLKIVQVTSMTWHNYKKECLDAMNLYIKIFSEPPYNETFELENVKQEFYEYIKFGCFLIATKDSIVVGFLGASKGINHLCSSEFITETKKNGFDCFNDIYISELGVSKAHRGLKIGKRLVDTFMEIYKSSGIFLRTGVENNDVVINMYKKYGFTVTDMREHVENVRNDGSIGTDERLYMYRKPSIEDLCLHKTKHSVHCAHDSERRSSGSEYLYGTACPEDNTPDEEEYNSGSEALYG